MLLAYNEELGEERIIIHHSDLPFDMWVLGSKEMLLYLEKNATEGLPLSADTTFNHGEFEVTAVTYTHLFIEVKPKNNCGKWEKASLIGPTIIQHKKDEHTYDRGFQNIIYYRYVPDRTDSIKTPCIKQHYLPLCQNHYHFCYTLN